MIDEITLARMADMLTIASEKTRLKIMLCLLGEEFSEKRVHHCALDEACPMIERSVNDIVAYTGASQSLVSHQLKILKDADLVRSVKQGRQVFYSLNDRHVQELIEVALEHVTEDK